MIPSEGDDKTGKTKDNVADAFSSSVVFENRTVFGAVAYDSEVATNIYDADFAGVGEDLYLADAVRVPGAARIKISTWRQPT
jgi:hypothetical protein